MTPTQTVRATTTICNPPIVGALMAMEKIIGPNRKWSAHNALQNDFLQNVFLQVKADLLRLPEMESFASFDYKEINSALSSRGFSIQLDPFYAPDFGVAAILKLVMEWLVTGQPVTICPSDDRSRTIYPAVRMPGQGINFYESSEFDHPIVELKTKTNDRVYLTMMAGKNQESSLLVQAQHMLLTMKISAQSYLGAIFPMIDLDVQPDISWLLGMSTFGEDGRPAVITQAKQQTKFKMDHIGAIVESAVALAAKRGIGGPKWHIIDRPFLAVVVRPGLSQPLFVGYLAQDCWKQPQR